MNCRILLLLLLEFCSLQCRILLLFAACLDRERACFFQNDKLVVLFYESDDRDADEIIEGLEGNLKYKNDFNLGPFPTQKKL